MRNARVTRFLLLTNILVYFFIQPKPETGVHPAVALRQIQDWYAFWALVPAKVLQEGYVWQLMTSLFLHAPGTILHLLFNMLALWSIGIPLEGTLGSRRFFWLYFYSGLAGSLLVTFLSTGPQVYRTTLGASGAILGLLAALAVFYPNSKLLFFFIPMRAITAVMLIGLASAFFIVFDKNGIFSHTGHLGGLLGGLLYCRYALGRPWPNFFGRRPDPGPPPPPNKEASHGHTPTGPRDRETEDDLSRFFRPEPKKEEQLGPVIIIKEFGQPANTRELEKYHRQGRPYLFFDPTRGRYYSPEEDPSY